MVILTLGILFWLFSLVLLARLVAIGRQRTKITAPAALALVLLLAGAGLLLFRPHEDVLGGQDPGAYLNLGARLGRQPRLPYTDELLAQVEPVDARLDFLTYGRGRPYLSKFACGRIRNLETALADTWFQPAYPIVMSAAARLGSPRWVLYVAPLYALLTALALGVLARLIMRHPWSGPIACIFYVLCPLVVWHARCPRPENIAGFLLFAGAALLVNAYRQTAWFRWYDVLLGAVCISLAPFFHITGWMLAIPGGLLVTAAAARGRRDFIPYLAVAVLCLALFVYQTLAVTDTYGLRRFVLRLNERWWFIALATALGGGLAFAFRALSRARLKPRHEWAGWAAALVVALLYLGCFLLALRTPPSKENIAFHYAYRTDLRAVLSMISKPIAILGLAGITTLAAGGADRRRERLALLAFACPATLLVGNLYDFFMTRYLLVAFLPLLALGLAALVTLIPARGHLSRLATAGAVIAVCLLGLRHRTHLVTTVEYRGLVDHLAAVADDIKREDGILLFEYPRLAAPLDHFFGVPVLALYNERDDDYSMQEEAWEKIMNGNPRRPAFFATPFGNRPLSDRFVFVPLRTYHYSGHRLLERRWALPTQVAEWGVDLQVYRMLRRDGNTDSKSTDEFPFPLVLDAGNMGFRRFANVRNKPRVVDGLRLAAGQSVDIFIPGLYRRDAFTELLFLFVADPDGPPPRLQLRSGPRSATVIALQLVRDWHLAQQEAGMIGTESRLHIMSPGACFLHDVIAIRPDAATSLLDKTLRAAREQVTLAPFTTRWARTGARFCVPLPATGKGYLLVLQNAPQGANGWGRIALGRDGPARPAPARTVPGGGWAWGAWYCVPGKSTPEARWIDLSGGKPFDPQTPGFPTDLISHVGAIVVTD